jgi:peptidoglycan/LPS O-acetylase OafA/YrhL
MTESHATTPPTTPVRRLASLDGLRGLAALAVIIAHAAQQKYFFLAPFNPLAMDVFFALSGFLVGGLALDAVGTPHWKARFWYRRALRIWPLYFVVCAVLTLTDPSAHPTMAEPHWALWTFNENFAVMLHFFRYHGWPRQAAGGLWSLAVEEHWYLLMPLVLTGIRRTRDVPVVFLAIACSAIGMRLVLDHQWPPTLSYLFTLTRFDALSFGVIGAWILRNRKEWLPHVVVVAAVGWGVVLGGLRAYQLWFLHDWYAVVVGQTAGSIGTAALCVLLASRPESSVARVLSWRPLAFVGTFSYGLYLLGPICGEVVPLEDGLLRAVATVVLSAPLAWCLTGSSSSPFSGSGRRSCGPRSLRSPPPCPEHG